EVSLRPNINRTGPTMPPDRTAERSHGRSVRCRRASRLLSFVRSPRNPIQIANPRPDPRYRSPANSKASTPPRRKLLMGVLMPKRAAASSADATPAFPWSVLITLPRLSYCLRNAFNAPPAFNLIPGLHGYTRASRYLTSLHRSHDGFPYLATNVATSIQRCRRASIFAQPLLK